MTLEPGDVVLGPFPSADLGSANRRPAFRLSTREHNAANRDVIVCGVTSDLASAAYSVLLWQEDMATGRLAAPSRVKADKVASISQGLVRRRVGRVRPYVLDAVLRESLGLFPAPA